MKKLLTLTMIAILGAAQARADDSRTSRSELVGRVDQCETILRQFMTSPKTAIPPGVWSQARGLMILSQFKAGFLFGVKGGFGVLMVKKPNGHWSVPVLIDAVPEVTSSQAWDAKDLLLRLGEGKSPPMLAVGADTAARKKYRDAWLDWWAKNHSTAVITVTRRI